MLVAVSGVKGTTAGRIVTDLFTYFIKLGTTSTGVNNNLSFFLNKNLLYRGCDGRFFTVRYENKP